MKPMILGAGFDDEAANTAFARNFDFNFPLLWDTDRALGLAYDACDVPDAGFARRISYLIGPHGKIARAYPKVDPKTHRGEVFRDPVALALSYKALSWSPADGHGRAPEGRCNRTQIEANVVGGCSERGE